MNEVANEFGRTLVAIMPFMFAGVVVIGAFFFRYLRRRETEQTLRLAIEKGVTLDPAVIAKLLEQPRMHNPVRLRTFGIIVMFAGLGLIGMHNFVGGGGDGHDGPFGAGVLIGTIGLGMLVASFFSKPAQPPIEPPQA